MLDQPDISKFYEEIQRVLKLHEINENFTPFSLKAINKARSGNLGQITREFSRRVRKTMMGRLNRQHKFVIKPYVRKFKFENNVELRVAIINRQAAELYGRPNAQEAFDFLWGMKEGLFEEARRFLDLGGHQLIWTVFYASMRKGSFVRVYEPSILNVLIGLYNCLINGVIQRVQVEPFAVISSKTTGQPHMLVDFINTPVTFKRLEAEDIDFMKIDIEGFEFELLDCPTFVTLLREAKFSHLELHLGHRVGEGISREDWLKKVESVKVEAFEVKSKKGFREFLRDCDPKGYHAFTVVGNAKPGEENEG